MSFALNPALAVAPLAAAFARDGRVEIRQLLAGDGAERLRAHLVTRPDWLFVMNSEAKVWEMPEPALARLPADQRATLDDKLLAAARRGFQFRYRTIRVPDEASARGRTLLDTFADFMASSETLAFLAAVTGTDPDFADAQATRYEPGDFLTRHDDDVAGKERQAAYVFGLAPDWRAEWGGLLLFHDAEGQVDGGFAPAMGALRLFRVPVSHSVSYVTPIASEGRLSVTGWLRRLGTT